MHIGDISTLNLVEIFQSPQINHEWIDVEKEIIALGISNHGGSNSGDSRAVYYLLRYLRPKSVLEIGTCLGATTARIAIAMRMLRSDHYFNPSIVTVDIADVNVSSFWSNSNLYSPREVIERIGFSDFVTFVTKNSLDYFTNLNQKFDLIFLDGSHDTFTVYQEIPSAIPSLARGGWILLHDYYPAGKPLFDDAKAIVGPFLAVKRLQNEGAKLEVLPFGNLPWWTRSNSSATSLAILGRRSS
jgi:predicted O-methyltransferase YrrM